VKSTGVIVPLGRKIWRRRGTSARFPDFVPACALFPS
jgi:hypothetical protein